jgi:hypothetical protein
VKNFNLQTPSGNPLVANQNGQTASLPELELLQQKYHFLEKVGELAQAHGADRVDRWMQLGGFAPTAPDTSSFGNGAFGASPTSSNTDLLGEVEALGLELKPNLITLIARSSVQQVKIAIAKYKTYRPLSNPSGLFYTILKNEPKGEEPNF